MIDPYKNVPAESAPSTLTEEEQIQEAQYHEEWLKEKAREERRELERLAMQYPNA